MPGEARPKTCSQRSKQAVEDDGATISPTTDSDLVTGDASNKTAPTANTTTTGPTAAAAAAAATIDGAI